MTEHQRASLRRRLDADPDAANVTLEDWTDSALSIGGDVWRLSWRGQATTAVLSDAGLATTCGALLDAIALHETGWGTVTDRTGVNLLVHRPMRSDAPTETAQALRSMRDAAGGFVRVWYDEGGCWVEDVASAPIWPVGDAKVSDWVDRLLVPRLLAEPKGLPVALVEAVADPSLQLYPSEIKRDVSNVWAIRIDGLEIGTADEFRGSLKLGKASEGSSSYQRATFRDVFGADDVAISTSEAALAISVQRAAEHIRELLVRFRGSDVAGAPVTHRGTNDARFVDEHALEARLLKGLVTIDNTRLLLDDTEVARGSQFPTLWGHGGPARYLDALLRRDSTPIAVELKVATGGQGRYYRRAITQAVLYRHFITNAAGLEPWFAAAELDRFATEAVVGLPIPDRYTAAFAAQVALLERVAGRLGVHVRVIDDRATADCEPSAGRLPEPSQEQADTLDWRLVAALSSRWPKSLGRVIDVTDAGGFYSMICLQAVGDRSLDWPAPRPRIRINRHGSTWVFNQLGGQRWTWRGLREPLANGASPDEAAEIIGRMAGIWPAERPDPSTSQHEATFAELAATFHEAVPAGQWIWQNAWLDGRVRDWVDQFTSQLRRYQREAPMGQLPTISRIWGAVHDNRARVIVDQENLRVWVWSGNGCVEVIEHDHRARIRLAAELVTDDAIAKSES